MHAGHEALRNDSGDSGALPISRVVLDTSAERVDVWTEHASDTRWPCTECQRELPCRDHVDERVWRHLDTCQYQTFLDAPTVQHADWGKSDRPITWDEAWGVMAAMLKRHLYGVLRNPQNFTTAIYFHCGGLHLYPG